MLRHAFKFSVLTAATFLLWPAGTGPCLADQPNVVLLMGDDHGWEETGYYGHPHVKTPVLDAMAASGLRLDNFYAAHPTCSPTRVSILTGRHPNRSGTFTPNCSTRPEEYTIAHLLGSAGYRCGHFGKWHVGPVKATSPTSPGALGFDTWLSHDNFFELDPILSRNGAAPERIEGEGSQVIVDAAKEFIACAKESDKPFLAVIWFGSPHEPYSGTEHDLALYDDLPEMYADRQVKLTSNSTGAPTTRPHGEVLRERYAEITAMDRAIGDLRNYLTEHALRDNTLVCYCGDNGTPQEGTLSSPLRGHKGMMYEGGIRVPGVIEWPNEITSPMTSTMTVTTSDILPTLAAVAGIDIALSPAADRPMDGINIIPLLTGNATHRNAPVYFWSFPTALADAAPYIAPEHQIGTTPLVKLMDGIATRNFTNAIYPRIRQQDYAGERVAIDGDFKLVLEGSSPNSVELFNLHDDRAETTNLSDKFPQRVSAMKDSLTAWQTSVLNSLTGADYPAK